MIIIQFLPEKGLPIKTSNTAKNVPVFSTLVAVPLKRVRQTALRFVYCMSDKFQFS